MLREAPRIETDRLVLRAFSVEDLDELSAIWADEDVVRYLGGQKLGREDTWRRTIAACGQWPFVGFGYWIAVSKADSSVVGLVGFADFKREIVPSLEGEPELGYVFATKVHGQGIAGEACAAVLAWADANLDAKSYPAIISPGNAASIRLAERLGFTREPDASYRGETIALFRRNRP